jgi:1,4-alpha-glucan branching enzyme
MVKVVGDRKVGSWMYNVGSYSLGGGNRYSASKNLKPVNFLFLAPQAKHVSVIGDFNNWSPNSNPMKKHPDGGWTTQIPLKHGHHRYQFLVDGVPTLDPRAQGVARNEQNEKVSLMSVS